MDKKYNYGLMTAITMIVGIVIGSGIFFKSDDILKFTGGSVPLGILVFCIGAFSIIFGSLSLTELSVRTEKSGGTVGYFEQFVSKRVACGIGWFQAFVYLPALLAVIAWVAGLYTCIFFGINASFETEIAIGFLYTIVFFTINVLSAKLGGSFQNASTIIKLIPLLVIAIVGLFWQGDVPKIPADIEPIRKTDVGFGWLAALVPIVFSFDGWVVALVITNEVKDPKKNMPRALIIGPLIVLGVYLLYFLGMNSMLGSEYIMSTGDSAIKTVGELLLGQRGANILLLFVIISVLGVLNGLILGLIRMPQALSSKNMLPGSKIIAAGGTESQPSYRYSIIAFMFSVIWLVIHYVTQKNNLIKGGDISEVSIVFCYACYTIIYIKVLIMKNNREITSVFKGIVCPVFAILGSAVIFIGSFIENPVYVSFFFLFCLAICILGFLYYNKKRRENVEEN